MEESWNACSNLVRCLLNHELLVTLACLKSLSCTPYSSFTGSNNVDAGFTFALRSCVSLSGFCAIWSLTIFSAKSIRKLIPSISPRVDLLLTDRLGALLGGSSRVFCKILSLSLIVEFFGEMLGNHSASFLHTFLYWSTAFVGGTLTLMHFAFLIAFS